MSAPKKNRNAVKLATQRASTFIYMRTVPTTKKVWARAAKEAGLNLSQWITETLNQCVYPMPRSQK